MHQFNIELTKDNHFGGYTSVMVSAISSRDGHKIIKVSIGTLAQYRSMASVLTIQQGKSCWFIFVQFENNNLWELNTSGGKQFGIILTFQKMIFNLAQSRHLFVCVCSFRNPRTSLVSNSLQVFVTKSDRFYFVLRIRTKDCRTVSTDRSTERGMIFYSFGFIPSSQVFLLKRVND